MRMLDEADQNNVEVSWQDQQSINAFSRLNSSYSDIERALQVQTEEKEALDDLALELELADEDEPVLYKVANSFVSIPYADATIRLEMDQERADGCIRLLRERLDRHEESMNRLKVKLYAKFGENINLERD